MSLWRIDLSKSGDWTVSSSDVLVTTLHAQAGGKKLIWSFGIGRGRADFLSSALPLQSRIPGPREQSQGPAVRDVVPQQRLPPAGCSVTRLPAEPFESERSDRATGNKRRGRPG